MAKKGGSARDVSCIDTHALKGVVRTMAKEIGMSVVFHDPDDWTARTNANTRIIHVPTPQWTWSKEKLEEWWGMVYHEIGHWTEGNREVMEYCISNNIDMTSSLGRLVNIIGDFLNDQQWRGVYPGAHAAVQQAQVHATDVPESVLRERYKEAKETNDPRAVIMDVFSWTYGQRVSYHPLILAHAQRFARAVPHSHLRHLDDELWDARDGESIVALAEKILKESDHEDEIEKGRNPESGEGEGEGEGKGEGSDLEDALGKLIKQLLDDHAEKASKAKNDDKDGTPADHEPPRRSGVYQPFNEYRVFSLRKR